MSSASTRKIRGKLLLAFIILSCGMAMHADPTPRHAKGRNATLASARIWQGQHTLPQARPNRTGSRQLMR